MNYEPSRERIHAARIALQDAAIIASRINLPPTMAPVSARDQIDPVLAAARQAVADLEAACDAIPRPRLAVVR